MKSRYILLFLFLIAFSTCQKSEPVSSSQPLTTYDEIATAAEHDGVPISLFGIKRNWNEVLAIAATYGLEDEFRDQERINNSLMRDTEDQLREFFKSQKQEYEQRDQRSAYMEKGRNIQCLSDYFNLMDSLPLYRRHIYPSDEEYAIMKKKYLASDYKFFINEDVLGPTNHISPYLIVVAKSEEMPQQKVRRIEKR